MKKGAQGKFGPYLSLLDYRNTPTDVGSSPFQRLQQNMQPATADTQTA